MFLNQQAVFSLPVANQVVAGIGCIVLLGLLIVLKRSRSWQLRLPLLLIIGGGTANLIQRILYGGVIDTWQLGAARLNAADIAIVVGAIWIVVRSLYDCVNPFRRPKEDSSWIN